MRVREAALFPATGAPLPARELMVVLESPLVHEAEYQVDVAGILNLSGVANGGGRATFRAPAAPPPPAVPAEVVPTDADEAEPAADDVVPDDAAPDGCHLHFEKRALAGELSSAVRPRKLLRLRSKQ